MQEACQDYIDDYFEKCKGRARGGVSWDDSKANMVKMANRGGCSGAGAAAVSAALLLLSAVALLL